jgi:hypothetical protein
MKIGVSRRALSIVATSVLTACASGLSVSSAPADGCGNEQLRAEQPYALVLPDCRAYEMVSPLDKNDNNVVEGATRAAMSGEAVSYESKGAFSEPQAALFSDRYISRRGPDGWSTRNITPPYHTFTTNIQSPFYELLFSPDLSKGLVKTEAFALTSDSPVGFTNIYVADTSGASPYQLVTTVVPPGRKPYSDALYVEPISSGVSTDLSRVVFQQEAPLTPEALLRHKTNYIYEWADGKLSLIDVPPDGKTLEAEDHVGSAGRSIFANSGDLSHAVSSDGLRVFFTGGEDTGPRGAEESEGQVYVREVDEARTVEVSASQRKTLDPAGLKSARYWDASANGSRVFFASRSELTDDANTGPADNAPNLYEYDLETGVLSDLTVDTNAGDTEGAALLGLVDASEDGSYVYFVAEGVLAEGAVSGKPNLYLHHAGRVTFIATLTPANITNNVRGEVEGGGDSQDWTGAEPQPGERKEVLGPAEHTVRVSLDGTHLAFESQRSLTGYDNEPLEPEACEAFVEGKSVFGPCKEVYVYDAGSGGLACASCDPSGARPAGPAKLGGDEEVPEAFAIVSPYYMPRNLSEDGSRLFFDSPDPLVPQDSNGRQDVYEYENGNLTPISDAAGNSKSSFLDAGANGNDVFIATADQLLPSDSDFRIDVYDVKVGGGLPVSVVPPTCANGDSCKGPVSPQPGVFGAPASATFSGAGNVAPVRVGLMPAAKTKAKARVKRCKKGFIRKRGRCVKQRAKRSSGHAQKGRK